MSGNILVTGGAGFIGLHLVKKLIARGYQVTVADNFSRGAHDSDFAQIVENPSITMIDVDLLDSHSLDKFGTDLNFVIHLAAIIGVVNVVERPYEVLVNNTRMLENVIALCRKQKSFSRLLFSSTSEVYAGTLKYFDLQVPTPECTPLAMTNLSSPRTSYMLSKIMGEAMCQHSGLPFTIFRPHNVYGPRMGMAHVIPEQLKQIWGASSGETIPVASPQHTRAFCFIDDATEMLLRVIEKEEREGKVVNIGSEIPEIKMIDLVQLCCQIAGKSLSVKPGENTSGSPARRAPDMGYTRELLDYQSSVSLEQGIRETWDWYRNEFVEGLNVGSQK